MRRLIFLIFLILSPSVALADVQVGPDQITLIDGSQLKGRVERVDEKYVYFDSPFLGKLQIERVNIRASESVNLSDVNSFRGVDIVNKPSAEAEEIESTAIPDDRLKSHLEIKSDIESKRGNTVRDTWNLRFEYGLKNSLNSFKTYGSFRHEKSNGEKTEAEKIIGFDYERKYSKSNSWYGRAKFEKDEADNINLRQTYAAGLAHFFYEDPAGFTLRGRAGVFGRQEDFDPDEDNSDAGLDLGLNSLWKINGTFELKNELVYTPSLDDFLGSYIVEHESSLKIWLTDDHRWSFELGFRHLYTEPTAEDRDHLDSTFFSNLSVRFE